MMWKIMGEGGRWASLAGARFAGDTDTVRTVALLRGDALPLTPTGPGYTARDDADPVWLWLAANQAIPGPKRHDGTPPTLPTGAADPAVTY